jgi:hypothetical protein
MAHQNGTHPVTDAQPHWARILEAIGEGTMRDEFVHDVVRRMNRSQLEGGKPLNRTMIAHLLQADFSWLMEGNDALLRDAHAVMEFYLLSPQTHADTASMIRRYTFLLVGLNVEVPADGASSVSAMTTAAPLLSSFAASSNLAGQAGSSSGGSAKAGTGETPSSGVFIDSSESETKKPAARPAGHKPSRKGGNTV